VAEKSLFARLTRYPSGGGRDQRENRLTAAFAAVLDKNPDIARALVVDWFGSAPDSEVSVAVQETVVSGIIDAAIRFGDPGNPDLLVWIEAKHGARESGPTQFARYADELRTVAKARETRLIVIAPSSFRAPDSLARVRSAAMHDGKTPLETWQDVFVAIERIAVADPAGAYLRDEFVRYMKEEGLAERAISTRDLDVLRQTYALVEANDAVAAVQERADERIRERWGPRLNRSFAYDYDAYNRHTCAPAGAQPPSAWADAELRWICESPDEDAAPSFYAGVWHGPTGPLSDPANQGWIASLQAEGFRVEHERKEHWLGRDLPLAAIVNASNRPEEQGECLADFVLETFRSLHARLPDAT
jgi:hypothetical protein